MLLFLCLPFLDLLYDITFVSPNILRFTAHTKDIVSHAFLLSCVFLFQFFVHFRVFYKISFMNCTGKHVGYIFCILSVSESSIIYIEFFAPLCKS